jgi:hypothetical protein
VVSSGSKPNGTVSPRTHTHTHTQRAFNMEIALTSTNNKMGGSCRHLPALLCGLLVGVASVVSGFVNSGVTEVLYPTDSLRNLGSLFPLGGSLPSSRVYHSVTCCIGENVVVYGGYSMDGSILNDIQFYDSRYQRWSNPLLEPECCNEVGDVIETMGSSASIDVVAYYAKKGFQGDLPLGRAEHGATVVNDKLYIFGGQSSLYSILDDMYLYDMTVMHWSKLNTAWSQSPGPRAGHSMAAVDGSSFVIFGGRAPVAGSAVGRASNPLYTTSTIYTKLFGFDKNYSSFTVPAIKAMNDVWLYNTARNTWTRVSPVNNAKFSGYPANGVNFQSTQSITSAPAGREHAAMIVSNGKLFVFGGQDPVSGLTFGDLWVFDLAGGSWQQLLTNTVLADTTTTINPKRPTSTVFVPPLHSATLIPATPQTSPALSSTFAPTTDSTNNTLNSPSVLNLLLYGGIGGGGSCGPVDSTVSATSTVSNCALYDVLGQVYGLQLYIGNLDVPKSVLDSRGQLRLQTTTVVNFTWSYARLTSASASRGRLNKNYALESVAYSEQKNQLWELGGIQSNEMLAPPLDSAGVPEPQRREVGGGLDRPSWNTLTGWFSVCML